MHFSQHYPSLHWVIYLSPPACLNLMCRSNVSSFYASNKRRIAPLKILSNLLRHQLLKKIRATRRGPITISEFDACETPSPIKTSSCKGLCFQSSFKKLFALSLFFFSGPSSLFLRLSPLVCNFPHHYFCPRRSVYVEDYNIALIV